MRKYLFPLLLIVIPFLLHSCKKEQEVIYGLKDVQAISPGTGKDKLKSNDQYVAILYTNLFQQAISSKKLLEINQVVMSIGDKRLAYELLISSFMNDPAVVIPSNDEMRANVDLFLINTYERFYVRKPTQLELEYFSNYIENNPSVTPELVYFAFAISDEYFYY